MAFITRFRRGPADSDSFLVPALFFIATAALGLLFHYQGTPRGICLLLMAVVAVLFVLWIHGKTGKAGHVGEQDTRITGREDTIPSGADAPSGALPFDIRSRFVKDLSLELRTPLNGVLGFSNLLLDTGLNAAQREYAQGIQSNAALMQILLEDVLDLSRLEEDRFELEQVEFDLNQVLARVVQAGRMKAGERPVALNATCDPELPSNFVGDPRRLRQVLLNLVDNAIKHTLEGEIQVKASLAASGTHQVIEDNMYPVTLTVQDTGIGIPPETQQVIFEAFSQTDLSINRRFGGTGLGLVIAKRLVEIMGGKIHFHSGEPAGSKFTIHLRLKSTAGMVRKDITPVRPDILRKQRAMIVDSNQNARCILEKFLDRHGITVLYEGGSPLKALKWLGEQSKEAMPDLLFTDLLLPEMDGLQFARKIRGGFAGEAIKLLTITADAAPGSAHRAEQAGFDAYLSKPYTEEELVGLIAAVLGDHREKATLLTRHLAEELSFKGKVILVVDSSPQILTRMEFLLAGLGCEVILVSDEVTGRSMLPGRTVDGIFLSLDLPGDREGFIQKVRLTQGEMIPVIGLTAVYTAGDQEIAKKQGFRGLISQPFDLEKIKTSLGVGFEK